MKKLLLTTLTAAGLVLSGQAAATPFYLDFTDDGVVNPLGPIEQLDLSYDSYTEIDFSDNSVVTTGGVGLVGYNFGGNIGDVFSSYADLLIDDAGSLTNTFTYTPDPGFLGDDFTNFPVIGSTNLTFDLSLTGTFVDGLGIVYTGGALDIYSYTTEAVAGVSGNVFIDGVDLLMSSTFTTGSINIGEQVVESEIVNMDVTAEGEDLFYFDGFISFEDYLSQTLASINVYAAQTVSFEQLAANIADPVAADGSTVLISDDHTASIKFQVAEPSTVAVFGLSLMGMFGIARRRRQK